MGQCGSPTNELSLQSGAGAARERPRPGRPRPGQRPGDAQRRPGRAGHVGHGPDGRPDRAEPRVRPSGAGARSRTGSPGGWTRMEEDRFTAEALATRSSAASSTRRPSRCAWSRPSPRCWSASCCTASSSWPRRSTAWPGRRSCTWSRSGTRRPRAQHLRRHQRDPAVLHPPGPGLGAGKKSVVEKDHAYRPRSTGAGSTAPGAAAAA